MKVLPGILKELLRHVPTVLFQATDWKALSAELPKLSRRLIQKEGYTQLFQHHTDFLPQLGIVLLEREPVHKGFSDPQLAAQKILTLYFAQLFSSNGVFLDLRPQHLQIEQGQLQWHPTGLWTEFRPDFKIGLMKIYDGFYESQQDLFHQGLKEIGLASDNWPAADVGHLGQLFREHFGSSIDQPVKFELQKFQQSLVKITDFLLEKKAHISTDFLYLGIYLVTMYDALERTGVAVDVKKIYCDTRLKVLQLR